MSRKKSRKNYVKISKKILVSLGISIFIGACITTLTLTHRPKASQNVAVTNCGVNNLNIKKYGWPWWFSREPENDNTNDNTIGLSLAVGTNCAGQDVGQDLE